MPSDFEIFGLDELIECFEALIDKWEEKKILFLKKIGGILTAEIKPLVPVDTSRLSDSFKVWIDVSGSIGSVEYGTNVEYALYVNDGHVQHRRFLPADKLTVGGKTKYLKNGNQKGIMLSERYVSGAFFMEKGMQSAKPRLDKACESFMKETLREAIGALL